MAQSDPTRRRSIGGAIFLIALGLLFLFFNLRPEADPWPVISRYWPLLLIFWGLGKVWDYIWLRQHPGATERPRISGTALAWILLLLLFGTAVFRGKYTNRLLHDVKTVDRQGEQSIRAGINMPAGDLRLNGGSDRVLEADFRYSQAEGTPRVDYRVSDGAGDLEIHQDDRSVHMGNTHNSWDLRFSKDLPLDLRLNMGAGEGDLRLRDVPVTNLTVNMGAGELRVDLTGDRKNNLEAEIHGGVGEARIRLPKNVGVRVRATGGIGSIDTHGLQRQGDEYVNDAYGKSPVTIKMTVEGGIGQINLDLEP